jgi:hypothetical protein
MGGLEDWRALLGYEDRASSSEDLIDPHRPGAPFYFQQMDAPRPQRNRVHLDVWVPYDQAEGRIAAAITAGGRLVSDAYAQSHWVLADPEGTRLVWAPQAGSGLTQRSVRVAACGDQCSGVPG